MLGDCHMHMILDGVYYRDAIDMHKGGVVERIVRDTLQKYADAGVTFLRDGGDAWRVADKAKELSKEYGIEYLSPSFPIHKIGRYGGFIGLGFHDMREYRALVSRAAEYGADFIKIMISGLMDFDRFGVLTCEPLDAQEISEMIHIAHEEGFAVMAHANGARTIEAAVRAGIDSIEHGAYMDDEAVAALAESDAAWVPTISTVGNLLSDGRYSADALRRIYDYQREKIAQFCRMGGKIGLGSDAGAYLVPHVDGIRTEYEHLKDIVPDAEKTFAQTEAWIRDRFRRG